MENLPFEIIVYVASFCPSVWGAMLFLSRDFAQWNNTPRAKKYVRKIFSRSNDLSTEIFYRGEWHPHSFFDLPSVFHCEECKRRYNEGSDLSCRGEDSIVWNKLGWTHRRGGPALIDFHSARWYSEGILHCSEGPAIKFRDGSSLWYKNGKKILITDK